MIRRTRGLGRKRAGTYDEQPLADINVTPFVDVVLVLLIIFMITAAVVEFGLQVSVPETTVATAQPQKDFQIVEVGDEGQLYYGGSAVNLYDIAPRIKGADAQNPTVYIRVHRSAPFERVAQLLAECKASGIAINLVPRPLRRNP